MKKSTRVLKWLVTWMMVFSLAAVGGLFVQVALPASPARAALPPRPSPMPTSDPLDAEYGGSIMLHISPVTSATWSEVEWQDLLGAWHKVDGWQGTLGDGSQTWWVGAKDLSTGPFRWRVYTSPGGTLLATSESFMLPSKPKQSVQVNVTLP